VIELGLGASLIQPADLITARHLWDGYPAVRPTDDWGALEVESGGALLNSETKLAAVSAAAFDRKALKGTGWKLILKKGWKIQAGKRKSG
jgi:hypothetical protein